MLSKSLHECLNALKELLSRTANDPPPPPVPTTEPLGSRSNPLPPLPLSPPPVPPFLFKEPKIDPPPEFHGKTTDYATFLDHCKFYFDNKSSMLLDNDKNKVSLIISPLRGCAAAWPHALRRSDSDDPVFISCPLFKSLMNSLFEDTYYLEQIHRNFRLLKQNGSAHNFSIEFKTFASIFKLTEDAKISEYNERLKDGVKKGIAYTTAIMNFDLLVAKPIEIDQVLFEIYQPAKKDAHSQKPTSTSTPPQPKDSSFSQSSQPRQAQYVHPPPMSSSLKSQGPRSSISQEERGSHKAAGLCIYCGESGHWSQQCPRLQTALKKGFACPLANPAASLALFQAPSSVPSTSAVTVPASSSTPFHSGNPPP